MIRSSLCDYSDACIHVKGTIKILNTPSAGADVNNTNKKKYLIEYSDKHQEAYGSTTEMNQP